VPVGLNVLVLSLPAMRPGLYVLRWQDAQGHTGSRKFTRLYGQLLVWCSGCLLCCG